MNRLTPMFAALAIALMAAGVAHADDVKRAESRYQDGVASMKEKRYYNAFSSFKSAWYSAPKVPKYSLAACEAATLAEEWESSKEFCDKAMDLVRGTPAAKKVEAMNQQRLEKIAAHMIENAESYRRSGSYDRAIKNYTTVATKMNRPSDWLGLCATQIDAEKFDDAKASCAKVKGKLAGEARKLMVDVNDRPNDAQAKAIEELGQVVPPGFAVKDGKMGTAGKCVEAVAAARKVGVRDSHWVPIGADTWEGHEMKAVESRNRGTLRFVRFADVAATCARGDAMKKAGVAIDGLERAKAKLDEAAKGVELTEHASIHLSMPLDQCRAGVDKALANGASPAMVLDIGGTKVELGKARAQICEALAAKVDETKAAWDAKKKAELEAKLAPFKKVMKGDKLALVAELELWDDDMVIQGKGGYRLVSPRDFAKASKWFAWSQSEDKYGRPIWEMEIRVFRGDKLVKTVEKHGRGTEPPKKAFR